MVNRKVTVILLAVAVFAAYNMLANAGDLEPAFRPGPTMKTLDEVEPRIPISQADIPLTITTPGSYYFTDDIFAPVIAAITVDVDDVTIDLMGFTLKGADTGTNFGIIMNGRNNVEIRNGTVRDFSFGVTEALTTSNGHVVRNVRVISNTKGGISLAGSSNLVQDCVVNNNGAGSSSNVSGISVGKGSTVINNTACHNGAASTGNVRGINGGQGCTLIGNTTYDNGNSANANSIYGILAGTGSTVIGNTAYQNGASATGTIYGIFLNHYCLVDQNTTYGNNGTNMDIEAVGCVYGNNVAPLVP